MNEQEVRKILREMLMVKSFGKSTLEYDEVIDEALASLKALEPKVEEIKSLIDKLDKGEYWVSEFSGEIAIAIVNYLKDVR